MLNVTAESLSEESNLAVTTASQALLQPRPERQGLNIEADQDPVWLKLWTSGVAQTASLANFNVHIPAGSSWPGTIGGVVWTGGVSVIGTGSPTGRVSATGV